jgi:trans-aconitate 2-methyltransferase
MTGWGAAVIERLELAGDERVLDAGCGTGQVTALLRERLPDGEVIALDGSRAMVDAARERLGGDRVTYLVHDLLDPIPIDPVDAILSTATFHWIHDHDRLFANLAAALRPGGALEAQCGGAGNVARVNEAAAALGHDVTATKRYAGPEETEARLVAAGFDRVRCWLREEPTPLPAGELEPYLRTVILGGEVATMSPDDAAAFVHGVAERLGEPVIDYVRLNISARRAG